MTWQGSDAGSGASDDATPTEPAGGSGQEAAGSSATPEPSATPTSVPPSPAAPPLNSPVAPPPPPGMPGMPGPTPMGAAPPPPPGVQPGAPGFAAGGGGWTPAPPTSRFAVPGAPGLEYAGALVRVVAYMIDALLLVFVTFAIDAVILATAPHSTVASYLGGLLATVINAAYFTLLWTSAGRATLGMRLMKLQVGNAVDGRLITPGQALRRWLAYGTWVSGVIAWPQVATLAVYAVGLWVLVLLVTVAMSPTKQGLHDRIAETAIVQPTGGAASQAVLGCLVVVLVVILITMSLVVGLIFLGSQVSTILSDIGTSV